MNESLGEALEFGTEIILSEGMDEYIVFQPGDYELEITKNPDTSKRFPGSAKMSACPKLVFNLKVTDRSGNVGYINHDLIMNKKMIGFITSFLCAFDPSIKRGQPLIPNWNNMIGQKAVANLGIKKWTNQNGEEKEFNQVLKFYDHGSDKFKDYYNQSSPIVEDDF